MATTKHKRKTKREKQLEQENASLRAYVVEALDKKYQEGIKEGQLRVNRSIETLRVEVATKFISVVGQSLQQFTDMLHDDGAISRLLK